MVWLVDYGLVRQLHGGLCYGRRRGSSSSLDFPLEWTEQSTVLHFHYVYTNHCHPCHTFVFVLVFVFGEGRSHLLCLNQLSRIQALVESWFKNRVVSAAVGSCIHPCIHSCIHPPCFSLPWQLAGIVDCH